MAGLRGFELANDDLPDHRSTAGEIKTYKQLPSSEFRRHFSEVAKATFAGSNPLSPATQSGLREQKYEMAAATSEMYPTS
jgi:hypothetical protein